MIFTLLFKPSPERQRAALTRELDHLYRELREEAPRTEALIAHMQQQTDIAIDGVRQQVAKFKRDAAAREQRLTARIKQLDTQELDRSIPARLARSW